MICLFDIILAVLAASSIGVIAAIVALRGFFLLSCCWYSYEYICTFRGI